MRASFKHDGSLGPCNLFNMTASSHHDESLGSYSLFYIRASFKHDGSRGNVKITINNNSLKLKNIMAREIFY
jgi:hypothetical protein